jgi:hypothetical protein
VRLTWVVRQLLVQDYGALHRLLTSLFPDYHLLERGYYPLSLGFCLVHCILASRPESFLVHHLVVNRVFTVERSVQHELEIGFVGGLRNDSKKLFSKFRRTKIRQIFKKYFFGQLQ